EPARDGQVVYFDPVDDLAVIAADVQAPPLPLTDAAAGDSAVVHGYPYGGPPSTVPAGVAATGSFRVPDIYGQSPTDRSVATLQSEIESGNSGGPVLSPEGEVMGVVFARDEARQDIGYALASNEGTPVLEALDAAQDPVRACPRARGPAPRGAPRPGARSPGSCRVPPCPVLRVMPRAPVPRCPGSCLMPRAPRRCPRCLGAPGASGSCPELCEVVGMAPFNHHIAEFGVVLRWLGPGEASSGSAR